MPSVFDVVHYILKKQEAVTAMKLQKLVYYSQAWSLVWEENPLFDSPIEAWANGPVCRELYVAHRKMYEVSAKCFATGNSDNLNEDQKNTIDAILNSYGTKTGQHLSMLTHDEPPWKEARQGVEDGEPSCNEITLASMDEYYSGL